jgi:hypothetical protein
VATAEAVQENDNLRAGAPIGGKRDEAMNIYELLQAPATGRTPKSEIVAGLLLVQCIGQ